MESHRAPTRIGLESLRLAVSPTECCGTRNEPFRLLALAQRFDDILTQSPNTSLPGPLKSGQVPGAVVAIGLLTHPRPQSPYARKLVVALEKRKDAFANPDCPRAR